MLAGQGVGFDQCAQIGLPQHAQAHAQKSNSGSHFQARKLCLDSQSESKPPQGAVHRSYYPNLLIWEHRSFYYP